MTESIAAETKEPEPIRKENYNIRRFTSPADYTENFIQRAQITRYMTGEKDFIPDDEIHRILEANAGEPDAAAVRDILAKSLAIETLTPAETAMLMNVKDPELSAEMEAAALAVKRKVYDNRVVTFAPFYMSNICVNNCQYCGFRKDNKEEKRRRLTMDEVRADTEVLAGDIGHKRLIVVYGEHPTTSTDYIADTIENVYAVKPKTRHGFGQIRRVNINAAPFPVEDLKMLHDVGIGTFQVFQETYHKKTYAAVHPGSYVKSDYLWRLYCMHRAFEAGVDDVGIGALFGLYDWKFEVLGLLYHTLELEAAFGIGPHTISFPRLRPASNAPLAVNSKYLVDDDDFQRLVTVLRLAVPYTGMIITAREEPHIRNRAFDVGCTQGDASSRLGVGAYSDTQGEQDSDRQQFMLGDTRSLKEMICDLASKGTISSFCTAGYRCGRTGSCIMDLLKTGQEGKFCKLNAVLTFREWLDDFADEKALEICTPVLESEIEEIRGSYKPGFFKHFMEYYHRIENGERDLYF